MRRFLLAAAVTAATASSAPAGLILTGGFDGPLSGGVPKAIELFATEAIADLSIYGVSSANNGGGATGTPEFTLSGAAAAGEFLYVASESTGFTNYFGFAPTFTSGAANINGDDAIELFMNGSVIDVFGEVDVDGSGEPWEYLDGWAYREDGTGPDGSTFQLGNWRLSGVDANDGETSNATASNPFPIGTFAPPAAVPEPTTPVLLAAAALGGLATRRRKRAAA